MRPLAAILLSSTLLLAAPPAVAAPAHVAPGDVAVKIVFDDGRAFSCAGPSVLTVTPSTFLLQPSPEVLVEGWTVVVTSPPGCVDPATLIAPFPFTARLPPGSGSPETGFDHTTTSANGCDSTRFVLGPAGPMTKLHYTFSFNQGPGCPDGFVETYDGFYAFV